MQPSDAVGMRIAAAVADQHLQVAGETDEQPRTIAANSEDRTLFPRSSSNLVLPFGDVFTQVSVLLALKKLNFSLRGISDAHVLPRLRSRPPRVS